MRSADVPCAHRWTASPQFGSQQFLRAAIARPREGRLRREVRRWARRSAPSPALSFVSSTGTSSSGGGPTPKRHRPAAAAPIDPPIGATPMGDDTHMACLGEGIANAIA